MNNNFLTKNNFKCGLAALIARPNAGKSTLLNYITGQKIAITTPVAQTTRKQIKGIYTDENAQIIFVDTPGIHKPKNELGEYLSEQSINALLDVDLILFLVDSSTPCGFGDKWIVENCLKNVKAPVLIVVNKIDLTLKEENICTYKTLFSKNLPVIRVSAKTGKNINILIEKIKEHLPDCPPLYPVDTITDQNMRMIAGETIREKIILNTKDEIPHSVAVLIDDYKSEDKIDKIKATVFVSQESQKGIIIGKNGAALKKIGTEARLELEQIAEKKIYLEIFVKVKKNWQKDKNALKMLGYDDV